MSHERPSLELRDFFARVSLEDIERFALSALAGTSEEEANRTAHEAMTAIPLVEQLDFLQEHSLAIGDQAKASQISYAKVLFIALYRLAEDMDYEW